MVVRTGSLAKRRIVDHSSQRCVDLARQQTVCSLDTYLSAYRPYLRRIGLPNARWALFATMLQGELIAPDAYHTDPDLIRRRAAVRSH